MQGEKAYDMQPYVTTLHNNRLSWHCLQGGVGFSMVLETGLMMLYGWIQMRRDELEEVCLWTVPLRKVAAKGSGDGISSGKLLML